MCYLLAGDAQGERQEGRHRGLCLAVVHAEIDDQLASGGYFAVAHHLHVGRTDADEVERGGRQRRVVEVHLDVGIFAGEKGAYMHGPGGQMQTADERAVILQILVVEYLDAALLGGLDAVYRPVGLARVGRNAAFGMAAAVGTFAYLQRTAVGAHVARKDAFLVFHYLVDDGGNAALGDELVVFAGMDGTGVALHSDADAVTGLEVVEQQVEELLETFAVVLHVVVEEIVDGVADGIIDNVAAGKGMGFLVVVAHEHVAVVGLEVVGRCRGKFGFGVGLVVVEIEFDG